MNKQALIDLANDLLRAEDLSARGEDLMYLRKEYRYLSQREEETFYERNLTDTFISLYEELAKKEPKLTQSPYSEKKEIIGFARKLLERTDIIKASKDLDNYTLSFKKAGRCSKEQDDELWAEFKEVRDEFNKKKRAYFEELSKTYNEKKAKKEEIIAKAKELLELKNIKEANAKMDALMEEWKAVGFSGKEHDEELWQAFSEVRKEFSKKKKEHRLEMEKLFQERANKKEEMIATAKQILADSDFSPEEVKRIKQLRNDFDKVGFAGKEKEDDLYNRFNEVMKKYFDEKKFYSF